MSGVAGQEKTSTRTRAAGATATAASSGSVTRRILLGSHLRRLRESRGISREAAGYAIRASESKISRMELGRVSIKPRDVEDLLTLYGVTDESEREGMVALARESNVAGWWHSYGSVLPSWFPTYVGLESAASELRAYELQFVHGLLQTEEYATAVVRAGHRRDLPAVDAQQRVALRMERQQRLLSENGPRFVCVLDEAALCRPYGGNAVMAKQLKHLIELSEQPHITLRVMPFSHGGHSAESGAFSLLRFAEPDLSDVVYLEQLTSALYVEKPEEVADYAEVFARLVEESLSPERTRDLLHHRSNAL